MFKKIKYIILSLRPEQWSKNFIIFAGILFAGGLNNPKTLLETVYVFAMFCLLSGASYIINDIVDIKRDRHIEGKRQRPIASGVLGVKEALIVSAALFIMTTAWSALISKELLLIVTAFIGLHLIYSLFLRQVVILDIFSIALSFLLRLFAGLSTLSLKETEFSSWILLCTIFLSLLLALCKRRNELILLREGSKLHRKSLEGYNEKYLSQLISIMAGANILSYSLYTLSPDTIIKHGTTNLKYTIPFVIYGIFRYLYLVYIKEEGLKPEKVFVKDIPFLLNILLYTIAVYFIVYIK